MLALDDLKVLDLTHFAPGQFCTMMLADMGADVIRVDQPGKTAAERVGTELASKWANLMDIAYKDFNRGKRSIILDLKIQEAREVLYRIARGLDVVVEGFRPGTVKRLGVDYQTLRNINPRIVYCSMSGYGQEGPYCDLPGHDINYIAMGGAQYYLGDPPPTIPSFIGDYAGGTLHAVIGILLALQARHRSGKGQHVDISYTDGVISLMANFAAAYFATGDAEGEGYRKMNLVNPGYGAYETKEGKYITLGCVEPWFWENLCRALGRDDYMSQYARWEQPEAVRDSFADIFRTKTRDEWFGILREMNVPVGKVFRIDELVSDVNTLHRKMLVEMTDDEGLKAFAVGIPIKLSETPGKVGRLAPLPGQHTEEILVEMGYSSEEAISLRRSGAVISIA